MTKLTPLGLAKILVVTISYQNIEAIYIYIKYDLRTISYFCHNAIIVSARRLN